MFKIPFLFLFKALCKFTSFGFSFVLTEIRTPLTFISKNQTKTEKISSHPKPELLQTKEPELSETNTNPKKKNRNEMFEIIDENKCWLFFHVLHGNFCQTRSFSVNLQ